MEMSPEMARSRVRLPFDTSLCGRKHFYLQVAVLRDLSYSSMDDDKRFLGIRVLDYICVNNCRSITNALIKWALTSEGKLWSANSIYEENLSVEYGPQIKRGDIIGIHIDLINGILEFDVNKIALGVASRNINVNSVYYLQELVDSKNLSLINLVTIDDTLQHRAFRSAITKMSCEQIRDILPCPLENIIKQLEFFTYCRGEEPDPQRFENPNRTFESPERILERQEFVRQIAEIERLREDREREERDRLRQERQFNERAERLRQRLARQRGIRIHNRRINRRTLEEIDWLHEPPEMRNVIDVDVQVLIEEIPMHRDYYHFMARPLLWEVNFFDEEYFLM